MTVPMLVNGTNSTTTTTPTNATTTTTTNTPNNSKSMNMVAPFAPVAAPPTSEWTDPTAPKSTVATLMLQDGTAYQGYSFGAEKDIAGECVFQTGMVGYPESLTDPSYRGQILVITFPLVGNYGVPPRDAIDIHNLPKYFESSQIHVSAVIVGQYSHDYSHYLASSSLADWLREQGVPAIYGVDTRALTKKIREQGVLLGKLVFPNTLTKSAIEWHDPNTRNLVAEVSTKAPKLYKPSSPNPPRARIMAVDVGMKYNQIRCFLKRGVELLVVPWDYDFVNTTEQFDGLFISNGPGDPSTLTTTIERVRTLLEKKTKPIFGICLGHQLMALASGAKTRKMKFGNRGHNIPCTDMTTGRCYITSQNHGFAVDVTTLSPGWEEYFINANDGSNEGIRHTEFPFFSVQFHPESTPGPWDTEYLFDEFIQVVENCKSAGKIVPLVKKPAKPVPERIRPRKVVILGSGGLSIGQAGEFDYSGSQAIKALKEENIYTILINPNIATIQTSKGLADKVYFLPVTPDFVRKVLKHEKPDGIYCTFGGQTALNVGVKLKDEFAGLGVRVLGTQIPTIELTEDRELFAAAMLEIGEHCAKSASATSVKDAIQVANDIGYPVIVRAAYALGGLGSGFASNEKELVELCNKAFANSPQVLVEKSMKGWKEIEYEVVRDAMDNCITVCNMENFDPLGIHTGDSIVVAPSQTLSDEDYMMLRRTAVNVVRHLGVVGECNIQYALNPHSKEYAIIEVNARLSRSSALASKATGYPLAFVAAKLGLGIPLTQVMNSVTKKTIACFEPSLDYCVVKIPRWDLRKFIRVSTKISSSMKSVGEVMSIGRNFEETIQKAIRCIDFNFVGFSQNDFVDENIDEELMNPSDQRLFAIANALHKGYSVDKIHQMTNIDRWFLNKLKNITDLEKVVARYAADPHKLPVELMRHAKQIGCSDIQLAKILGTSEMAIRKIRTEYGVTPFVKQIDTVAAEFPAFTNYLYMTYNASEHDISFDDKGIIVLGSGVYRIGSSVEFDWCAVRAIRTLRANDVKTIMINFNPETVSTDYDEADRLYFESITLERVLDIYEIEKAQGIIVSMGGQTPNNIALPLQRQNVKILGTSPEMIDNAENRYKFSRMLDKIGVDQPQWKELTSVTEATAFCDKVGFPVLVRPSYVLSGAGMTVVYSSADLSNYLEVASEVSKEYPVVISKFIEEAKEIELDAVADNGDLIMHVITEHVENAGVHSGDATLVLPPQDLDPETVRKIEVATRKIANALNVTGPINIQFIAKNNEIKVIECNLRASRSFPFVSKVLGVDLIEMATKAMIGAPYEAYPKIEDRKDYVAVKVPQFSFSRLSGADPILGVEMASTGEVACFGRDKYEAYLKALISTGFQMPKKNVLISIGSFKEKLEFLPSVQKLHDMGYNLFATSGTADFIQEHGIPVKYLEALEDDSSNVPEQKLEYSLTQHLANNLIDLYINLPSKNRYRRPASYMSRGYRSRRMAVDFAVPLITNIKCGKVFIEALSRKQPFEITSNDFKSSHRTIVLPGLVNIQSFLPNIGGNADDSSFGKISKAAVAGGFTMVCNAPIGTNGVVADKHGIVNAQNVCKKDSFCDYTLSVCATSNNARLLSTVVPDTASLYVPFDKRSPVRVESLSYLAEHFKNWPTSSPIVVDASESDLASVLFFASLHDRSVHVTQVKKEEDILLISMSKAKGVKVTCDVAVHNLFLSTNDFKSSVLGSPADVEALWNHMDKIDCFSIGNVPYYLAKDVSKNSYPSCGVDEALPLLLTAIAEGKLTVDDVKARLYDNPRRIFELPEQPDTYIEVEIDRKYLVPENTGSEWSPLTGKVMSGVVHRVVLRGQTVYLGGSYFGESSGRDVSGLVRIIAQTITTVQTPKEVAPKVTSRRTTITGTEDYVKSPMVKEPKEPSASATDSNTLLAQLLRGEMSKDSLKEIAEKPEDQQQLVQALRKLVQHVSSPYILDIPSSLATIVSKSPFYRKSIVSVKQFTRSDLHVLFGVAQEMRTLVERQGSVPLLAGKVLCSAFFEPSTRTSASFETAMVRLGGEVVSINQITSSIAKGESMGDTVRTLGCYGDVIVIRHPEPGSAGVAAKYSKVPVINAGDGIGEHPSQAFLDAFTIREELGTVNGLTITLVGDLKNGRTVHSLVKLLSMYDVKINYVSPTSLRMPDEIIKEVAKTGIQQQEFSDLNAVIGSTDVLYVTRIQKERFANVDEYEKVHGSYIITNAVMQKAKPHMIVMHPLPRINEIDPEVDFDQRAAYFRQMRYGLYVRMALLALVCGRSN